MVVHTTVISGNSPRLVLTSINRNSMFIRTSIYINSIYIDSICINNMFNRNSIYINHIDNMFS